MFVGNSFAVYFCALLLVFIIGCGKASDESQNLDDGVKGTDSISSSNEKSESSHEEVGDGPPRQSSLTPEEYIQAGMPSYDRQWAGVDMQRALRTLNELAQTDLGTLPRYGNPRSGLVFDRLTAESNLAIYRNYSLPLEQRLIDFLSFMQASSSITKLYLTAFTKNAVSDAEMVELSGSQLRVMVVCVELKNEFVLTLDPQDPSYATRMAGVKQMTGGLALVVAGSLQTLTESHAYSKESLSRFAGYVRDTFPTLLAELSPNARLEAMERIRRFIDDPMMKHLHSELIALRDAVQPSTQFAR